MHVLRTILLCVALLDCRAADDSPKKACSSTLKGDYQFEACGAFCKEAKKGNHCKFCKCKSCTFCSASAQSSVPPPALSPRQHRSPPPPRWPKKGGKKKGNRSDDSVLGGMGGSGGAGKERVIGGMGGSGGAGKEKCQSGLKGDLPFMSCAMFCKSTKATNHCKFCKCRTCQYCAKDGKPAEGFAVEASGSKSSAAKADGAVVAGASLATTGGLPQRGMQVDRVASTGASHARVLHGVGVAILLVLVGLGLLAYTSQGDATVGTLRHTMQTHLSKMGLSGHGVEGNRLKSEETSSDLDAAFRAVDKLEADIGGQKR